MENNREEFEKYHLAKYGKAKVEDWLTWDTENACYAYSSTDALWNIWQEQQKKIDELEQYVNELEIMIERLNFNL